MIGFPWAIRVTGFMVLFLMIIANLTIRSRMPPFKKPVEVFEFLRPFKELPFDLVAFGSFIFFLGMFLPINYIILEAIHYGMNPKLAQYMVPILNAVSFFGRTVPGFVADKIGRFNMMVIMCGFTGIIILALWLPATSNAPIIVFAALFGFGSGAFVSLAPSVIAQISDVRQIGVRTGSFFAVISIAALISQPIGGALITRWHGSYTGLQIYAGVLCVGG
jgi:MFS family permease